MKSAFFRVILRIITTTINLCFAQVTDYRAVGHLTLYIITLIDIMTQRVIITVNVKENKHGSSNIIISAYRYCVGLD